MPHESYHHHTKTAVQLPNFKFIDASLLIDLEGQVNGMISIQAMTRSLITSVAPSPDTGRSVSQNVGRYARIF